MSNIKLFSGMDFSGKSTIVSTIMNRFPNQYICQEKFLSNNGTLQYMIEHDIWLPPKEEFIPLLCNWLENDLQLKSTDPILQDTLWALKFIARLKSDPDIDYSSDIKLLEKYVYQYPSMDSFYVYTTIDERIKRYHMRKKNGKRISKTDLLIFNADLFSTVESNYRELVFKLFPNTVILDTTKKSANELVDIIEPILLEN